MGVMITIEQIRYAQGPSLRLPWSPNPLLTAGRTNTMVDDPVIANTVQRSTISLYQANVHLGGISLGPKNRCRKVVLSEAAAVVVVEVEAVVADFVAVEAVALSASGFFVVKRRRIRVL